METGYSDSFNGKMRYELLDGKLFPRIPISPLAVRRCQPNQFIKQMEVRFLIQINPRQLLSAIASELWPSSLMHGRSASANSAKWVKSVL
jgi:hypothetical protein